ncbi:DUF5994 family protein [Nocardia jiangxiensis]|uniref:DUF5994 family protein n=1 Tax=Nocardia jiangxiensis TaxID=282685 RepID=A0ABW6RRF5_9NOCA|nr:DUF5994 family protein [Nocardia jiangxiensis]
MLRERDTATGSIDGAWWPRTAEPMTELHQVIDILAPRLGRLEQIGFDWNTTASTGDGGQGGIMQLFGLHGTRLALLVVPADTATEQAATRMRWATGQPLLYDRCTRTIAARVVESPNVQAPTINARCARPCRAAR